MKRGLFAVALGLFAVSLIANAAGTQNVATTSGAVPRLQRAGLTQAGLARTQASGTRQDGLVMMSPQTDLNLLQQARLVGPHVQSERMELTVSLKLHNVAGLLQFLREVQIPGSPKFHHFLTPSTFTARYGPTQAEVQAVVTFLKQRQIRVKSISPNRLLIHTTATTQAYEHALAIRINDYKLNGRSFFSTPDQPKLPSAVAGYVENIIGLSNAVVLHPMHHLKPFTEGGVRPAVAAPPPASSGYYNPMQIAKAYQWPSVTNPANAAGVTIAIMTADSSNVPAINYTDFWSAFNLPSHVVNFIAVDGNQGATDGIGETLLDMEWSGAMAPGATLNVYVGADATLATFIDVYNKVVTDDVAQVATVSWGAPETTWGNVANTANAVFMQAAAEGISVFAAAGDNGASDGTGSNNVPDYPSSDPYVTAANGTELRADKSGQYISETAWSDTGGAVSQIFTEPEWQIGPGVPQNGHRNNSDMSFNGGSAYPFLLRYKDAWYLAWGTSAVAPQLAAMFAVGVSKNGRIGQSNSVIYNVVNANDSNYANDFHDVTMGCNGKLPDGSPSCAGTAWDHPTGWGSPKVTNLLSHLGVQGPRGTLQGTVTAVSSGTVIRGARVTVTPGDYSRVTSGDGGYSFVLPTGNYNITVQDYGYESQHGTATIADDKTVTRDFMLPLSPRATITGKVTDGSGHGYGLYANIKVTTPAVHSGQVANVWTNPKTGSYSLKVPQGLKYTMNVTAALDGYNSASATVTPTGDLTRNFAMETSATCSAPGYRFTNGFGEDFNGEFPPTGWSVKTPTNNGYTIWQLNTAFGDDNYTGGSGTAAEANSDHAGNGQGAYDTRLISPPIPVSSLPADAVLKYRYVFLDSVGHPDALDLGVSTDGGAHWTQILSAKNCGSDYSASECKQRVDLGPYLPESGNIRLRWRYHDSSANAWDWYSQIDDVVVGTCQVIPGGLVLGQVKDGNTGKGILRATVSNATGYSTTTIVNPVDSKLSRGFYMLFTPSGDQTMKAGGGRYQTKTAKVSMTDNAVITQNFSLNAGQLTATPVRYDAQVPVGGHEQKTLTLKNSGTAPAHFQIVEVNSAASTLGAAAIRATAVGTAAGSVVASFNAGVTGVNGLGVDRNAGTLWVGSASSVNSAGTDRDYPFLFNGTAMAGAGIDVSVASPAAGAVNDMAYNDNTGMLWQMGGAGAQFCIFELNPATREAMGNELCPDIGVFQTAIAYDPTTNTWYSDSAGTETVYHFNSAGQVLSSKFVPVVAVALAYNSATGHLFALTSHGKHDVFVLDPANNYKILGSFDVNGLKGNAGAGLDYGCNGDLWATDAKTGEVYEFRSGESGWCDFKEISWLTETPSSGTIAPGASVKVTLGFDGNGQQPSTTTNAGIVVQTGTPYEGGTIPVPLKVTWTPAENHPPVASDGTLVTKENTSASGVLKASDPDGDPMTFSIVAQPTHGSVKLTNTETDAYTYTPDKNYTGDDSFTFKANDGQTDSNVAAISVTVQAVAPPPPPKGGGGGALGGASLGGLLGLILLLLLMRQRRLIGKHELFEWRRR